MIFGFIISQSLLRVKECQYYFCELLGIPSNITTRIHIVLNQTQYVTMLVYTQF